MTQLTRRTLLGTAAALPIAPAGAARDDTARLNAWLEERYQFWLGRSPMTQTKLGLKTSMDTWDDIGEARAAEDVALVREDRAALRRMFDTAMLSSEGKISHTLYDYKSQREIDDYRWRFHLYPVNQMFGWQQTIPTFLINFHRVANRIEAEAYIARLIGASALIDQVIETLRLSESAGVLAPQFVYDNVLRDCRNVITGAPFDQGPDSTLLADIKSKIAALPDDAGIKQKLLTNAESALRTSIGPAYRKLIAAVEGQRARAGTNDGVWHLPDGEAFYAYRLKYATTTDMTAEQIHEFGRAEVDRIRGEMQSIMKAVKFKGDLKAFFAFTHDDPQFYFPQTEDGKKAYLARAQEIISAMRARLPDMFTTLPKAELVLKPVEPFREQSATSAFYESPGPFDRRPGIFYVNTFDMRQQPTYEMESLAYHEAIPGHHMQIALAQEKQDIPKFRRFSSAFTAYVEGWGLYCERMPKDFGFYKDLYSDYGRLTNELWRACRLVVDTALHHPRWKWSREQAIAYLREMTPNAESDCVNSVERYIVMPGQATAYKIGMTRIIELRDAARKKLGAKFDIRAYHDLVLASGALPLFVLSDVVDAWVKRGAA